MSRFSSILFVVDTAADNPAALQQAVALAQSHQAALTVCTVLESNPTRLPLSITAAILSELREFAVAEKHDLLVQMAKDIANDGLPIETAVLVGKPFVEVIRQVFNNCHDLVIKCAEKAVGVRDVLFGSTDMNLMRNCPCPVWIIKPADIAQCRRIMAAVDQDPEDELKDILNRQILEVSMSLALAEFGELHIVHAWEFFGEGLLRSVRSGHDHAEVDAMVEDEAVKRRRWVEDLLKSHSANAGEDAVDYVEPTIHSLKGPARRIIPAFAQEMDVDLIVMGTVSRGGISGFIMGNTAEEILGQIDCSVLTIKPPGFESPVTA